MPKLRFRIQPLGHVAFAALLAGAFSTPAVAAPATGLFAGGATFPSRQFRDLFNCFGDSGPVDGAVTQLEVGLPAPPAICGGVAAYRPDVQVLYLTVGSGLGLTGWRTNNPADLTNGPRTPDNPPVASTTDFGPFYGVGAGSTWVPNTTDAGPFFPRLHFAASDDPVSAANLATYNANKVAGGWGNAIQLPAFVGAVTISFNPASGGGVVWTEKGKKPAGGGNSSLVSLTTDTWCGIWTGAITDWNDAEITADNGNVSITGGVASPITIRYRSDGSGTTWIFVNALLAQCNQSAHPVPDTWEDAGPNTLGQPHNSWFINVAGAGLLPPHFIGAPGNGGVAAAVVANPGNIGYNSTDFVQPFNPGGPKSMNLQTYYTFTNSLTPVYKAATAASAAKILAATATTPQFKAPSFAGTCGGLPQGCANDPLAWGKNNPLPLSSGAFPIGGYTFFLLYTCYNQASDVDAIAGVTPGALGLFRWWFGTATENFSQVKNSLAANGFAPVPGAFNTAAKKLLTTNKPTKLGTPGQANTGCATVVGPGV